VEQRNAVVSAVNENVRVFIMASPAASEIAHAVQDAFKNEPFKVDIWTDGVLKGSSHAIDGLEGMLDQSDVAIAVVEPDGKGSPRDGIIFELGFFMGRLGRHRAFLIESRADEIK